MSKKIRVLEAIRQGSIGGGERHVLDLVEELDRDAFEPVVLAFTDGPMIEELHSRDVPCHVIPTEKPFDLNVIKQVRELIQKETIDLVHAHGTRAYSNVIFAARKLKLPMVYTVHGWSFHDDQPFWRKKMAVLTEGYLTRNADTTINVSRSNQETGKRNIRKFSSEVINNGINLRVFDRKGSFNDIRAEFGIEGDHILVGFIARMTHQKSPLNMIRAFHQASLKNPNLRLLMVGEGELDGDIDALLSELDNDKIIKTRFRSDVPHILNAMDIYCLPSLWEGLSIGLLEAMGMGNAIIASRVDGTVEMIRDQENGLLVDPDHEEQLTEALIQMSSDEPLRRSLGEKAYETVSGTFDARNTARKTEDIYKKLSRSWN